MKKTVNKLEAIITTDEFESDRICNDLIGYWRTIKDLEDSIVYYMYPVYVNEIDNTICPKLILVSPVYGVYVINTSDFSDTEEIKLLDEETSRVENSLYSKFISYKSLHGKNKRELSFKLRSLLYLPCSDKDSYETENRIVINENDMLSDSDISVSPLSQDVIKEICSVIEGTNAIIKPKHRTIINKKSKGYLLKQLENQLAYFDRSQKCAAFSLIDGPQRICGLAGSGKTIILCLKAAYIHLKFPEKKILYTFYTKSLYDFIETTITRIYKRLGDGSLPDFENKLHIRHAWGGAQLPGVYYSTCKNNGVSPKPYMKFGNGRSQEQFDKICFELLKKNAGILKKEYDYVLMDEAQDFEASFYQICRAIVKNDCLVWCYDDLQNIFDVNIEDHINLFENEFGAKGINLEELNKGKDGISNDITLPIIYRNPHEILMLAHAIDFGIYREGGLIQYYTTKEDWVSLGYKFIECDLNSEKTVVIERVPENRPSLISKCQSPEQIIEIKSFNNKDSEVQWVAESIISNIQNEEILPDDILVIGVNGKIPKKIFEQINDILNEKNINTYNVDDNSYTKGFFKKDHVTFSSINRAKGNEAAIVYVIGINKDEEDSCKMRDKFYTAFTRSKAWLKISGVEIENNWLCKEIKQVFDNKFVLKFKQP